MNAWIVIIMALFFVFCYFVMKAIDRFWAEDKPRPIDAPQSCERVLIVGCSACSDEIMRMLEARDIPFTHLSNEQQLPVAGAYRLLLAADTDDQQNLFVSAYCRRMLHLTHQVLLCNDPIYEPIFRKNGVPYITDADDIAIMRNAAAMTQETKS